MSSTQRLQADELREYGEDVCRLFQSTAPLRGLAEHCQDGRAGQEPAGVAALLVAVAEFFNGIVLELVLRDTVYLLQRYLRKTRKSFVGQR